MKHIWKKTAAGLLAMALVVGAMPANVGTGGFLGGTAITVYAMSLINREMINVSDSDNGTLSNGMTCTNFNVRDNSTLTIKQGVTLTLNCPTFSPLLTVVPLNFTVR